MEILIWLNLILTLTLCVVVFLHIQHYRKFANRVAQFALSLTDSSPLKRGIFVGIAAVALIALLRKMFGGSDDESIS